MLLFFYSIPWYVATPLVMAIIIALSIGGLLLVRRRFSHHLLKSNNDVAGFTFGVVGVLYALQLGFTMLNVQQRYDKIHDVVHKEANELSNLYKTSIMFPEISNAVRADIKSYMEIVMTREYEKLARGEHEVSAFLKLNELWKIYEEYTPKNEHEGFWYSKSINILSDLTNYRLNRLHYSQETLDPIMWALLLGGGAVVIGFMYLFGVDNLHAHIFMISALAGCITFILLIIIYLDNGFLGVEAIRFRAFQRIIDALPWL